MIKNGRTEEALVAGLLTSLSEEVKRLRATTAIWKKAAKRHRHNEFRKQEALEWGLAEMERLQAEIERLRPFTDDYPSLMDFLSKVAEVVAEHPDAEQASTYFAAALQTARRRLSNDT